ncbi:MAG: sugar phosphate isomerase/epimerase [Oscillospiraceae bacterium]|nr:sugar phosphate isomerase/epimerase [Oscillospiraceae bacterium]
MALKIGIQLYSVRESLKKDPFGTLAKVAEAGYKYVEAANHNAAVDDGVGFGLSAKEMKKALDDLGMSIVGCHINPLDPERLKAVLDYHQELGNPQIGCDIEFFPHGDVDFVLRRCELFNKVGELCKARGMKYYYHNHFQEFQKFDGKPVYEIILENTDPGLVFVEMDTYWITRGGYDPVKMIEKYSDRLVLLHQKDFPKNAPQPICMYDGLINPGANISHEVFSATKNPLCFTEIGTGVLPIQNIINAAQKAPHLQYMLLEQDHTQLDELDSIRTSMAAFSKFDGISFE